MPQGASSASLKNEHSPPQGCALVGEARERLDFAAETKQKEITQLHFGPTMTTFQKKRGAISQAGLLFYTAFVGAQ